MTKFTISPPKYRDAGGAVGQKLVTPVVENTVATREMDAFDLHDRASSGSARRVQVRCITIF